MSNLPKIYGTCKAGCLWETVHKSDFERSASIIPLEEGQDGINSSFVLEVGKTYKVKNSKQTNNWLIGLTLNADYTTTSGQSASYNESIPLVPFDKYNEFLKIKLCALEVISDSLVKYVIDINGTRTEVERGIFDETNSNKPIYDWLIANTGIQNDGKIEAGSYTLNSELTFPSGQTTPKYYVSFKSGGFDMTSLEFYGTDTLPRNLRYADEEGSWGVYDYTTKQWVDTDGTDSSKFRNITLTSDISVLTSIQSITVTLNNYTDLFLVNEDAEIILRSEDSEDGTGGKDGADGKSAYEIAVDNGFEGTETEWLASLKGKSAYEIAVDNGFEGTEAEWLESLKGTNIISVASEEELPTDSADGTIAIVG